MMVGQMFRTFSMFLQYIVPAAFMLGALASVIGRSKRRKLLNDAASAAQSAQIIDGMSWREFEKLVGEAFRRKGFAVTETGGSGPDGGVDLILYSGNDKYLVQCKQWRAIKVGVTTIREFYGALTSEGASGGFVVTSGRYTEDAKSFANGRNIELIEGDQLRRRVQKYKTTPGTPPKQMPIDISLPSCHLCGAPMIKRTAKKGANIGKAFLGCSRFPSCRGIKNLQPRI